MDANKECDGNSGSGGSVMKMLPVTRIHCSGACFARYPSISTARGAANYACTTDCT